MPPVPPNLPDVSAVVLHYTSTTGATAVNRMHVLSSGLAALDVFNRFVIAWPTGFMGHTSSLVTLFQIDITRLDNQTATQSFTPAGSDFVGTQPDAEFSPATAMLIKYTTGFRGLGSQGRTYAPMVAEPVMSNGRLLQAFVDNMNIVWTEFINTLTTQTIPMQVVSYGRFDHETLPDAPAVNHTVTAVTVNPVLGTQRNRQSRLFG